MLRIAKSTPGVLDLSAVKDEYGLPVTLIGASYRDVPDHEESNPVLQRIVELGWVTVSHAPLKAVEAETASIVIEPGTPPSTIDTSLLSDTLDAAVVIDTAIVTDDTAVGPPDVASGAEPPQDAPVSDVSTRSDGSAKPVGKSDARKAGRRS